MRPWYATVFYGLFVKWWMIRRDSTAVDKQTILANRKLQHDKCGDGFENQFKMMKKLSVLEYFCFVVVAIANQFKFSMVLKL
jgi:hypothetical protein